MWNNLFSLIVAVTLVGTFVRFSTTEPRSPAATPQASYAAKPVQQAIQPIAENASGEASGQESERAMVKIAIEASGYQDVAVVGRSADGLWHAWARRGMERIALIVDQTGRVAEE